MREEGVRGGADRWLSALAGAGLALLVAGIAAVPLDRAFDTDEFQHLQMGWLMHEGAVPYRDFFEHHTSLFHFGVGPLLAGLDVARDAGDARAALERLRLEARALSLALALGVFALARRLCGAFAGLAAALALVATSFFVQKGLEVRPDPLAALALLAATLALVGAGREPRSVGRLGRFALAGAAAAAAVLATQKSLLALPGLAVAGWLAAGPTPRRVAPPGLAAPAAAAALGAIAVALPIAAWFAERDALDQLVRLNFLLNAAWPARSGPLLFGRRLVLENPLCLALAAAGAALAWRAPGREARLVLAPLASLAAGLLVLPVVMRQYYFLMLPFLAVLAGLALAWGARRARAARIATAGLVVALAASGGRHVWSEIQSRDREALAKLAYVVEETPPDATVLGAWSPGIAFRRPAFFYGSLHREIRQVVSAEEWAELLAGLESGRIAPELVEMDKHMRRVPDAIVRHLEEHYAPTGVGTLWRRKASVAPSGG